MPVPGPPKDVHIDVILNSEAKGDFRIEPHPENSLPKGPGDELVFENKGHSGFFIYFHLKDPNKLGYKFPDDHKLVNDAVWSKMGKGACPDDGIWDVFIPRKVIDKGMTLKVRNLNEKPDIGDFGYTLRVTKDEGRTYLALDPGGTNKNGPISASSSSWIAPTVAGGLVGLGAIVLTNSSIVPSNALLFGLGGAVVGLVVGLVLGRR